jgi:hypothetical protein
LVGKFDSIKSVIRLKAIAFGAALWAIAMLLFARLTRHDKKIRNNLPCLNLGIRPRTAFNNGSISKLPGISDVSTRSRQFSTAIASKSH